MVRDSDCWDVTGNSYYLWDTVIVENGVRLRLNIVDTPGYGDQVNNEAWYVLIQLQHHHQLTLFLTAGTRL